MDLKSPPSEDERIARLERRFDHAVLWFAALVVFFACLHTYGRVDVSACVTSALWATFAWGAVGGLIRRERALR